MYERIIQYVHVFQEYDAYKLCTEGFSKYTEIIYSESYDIYLRSNENIDLAQIYIGKDSTCKICKRNIEFRISFINNLNFLFIESLLPNIKIQNIPQEIEISSQKYNYLCSS